MCEGASHAKRVVSVVLIRLIAHQEVLSELGDVREALETGVHKAGVAEVLQATEALIGP